MIRFKVIYIFIAFALFCITCNAQISKKRQVRKGATAKIEKSPADALYENMLGSTARVMFIDSIVTDKANFLKAIPLNKESGTISTYDAFWKTSGHESSYTYMNEFGNKVIFSMTGADGHSHLYSSDKLNGQWSQPKAITDFDNDFEDINCPFMMSDGVTLYFAGKGKGGLGKYDLYVTMYDTDSARFYKPENIGLPYNSKANDYYYIIDEFNSLGWLVTDRNQPEGKVCIYTFVPTESRETYNVDTTDRDKLLSLASINSIRDSWTDKNKLQDALKRLAILKKRKSDTEQNSMSFYINDRTVYSNPQQFVVPENRIRYAKLNELKKNKEKTDYNLETLRNNYYKMSKNERDIIAPNILKLEKYSGQLDLNIKILEKTIRNTENTNIK